MKITADSATSNPDIDTYDLAVIGTGMTGMAASLIAADCGLSVAQAGLTGEILFSSGFFDFLAIHPVREKRYWTNPWEAVHAMVQDNPGHPYARISAQTMHRAWDAMLSFLEREGLPYYREPEGNTRMITSQGTIKSTYCLPLTMQPGANGLKQNLPCLIADFHGMREFSAVQIAESLHSQWKGIRTLRIHFPGTDGLTELYPERMARALELPGNREKLAMLVKPHVKEVKLVGLPAVLGIERSLQATNDLSERLGLPVFEIPTIPPSVPGIRLKETFEKALPQIGVRQFLQKRVLRIHTEPDGLFRIDIGSVSPEHMIKARAVILATGRFFGGGLYAERNGIRETVMGLDVVQPSSRSEWHREDFFDPSGHPINHAGLETDDLFRPLDASGHPAYPNLFAAGSILAHQDWIRSKSGVGLAICSATAAVESCIYLREGKR
jgi:glycerol-3-phosphate dehydrogenase subunit B